MLIASTPKPLAVSATTTTEVFGELLATSRVRILDFFTFKFLVFGYLKGMDLGFLGKEATLGASSLTESRSPSSLYTLPFTKSMPETLPPLLHVPSSARPASVSSNLHTVSSTLIVTGSPLPSMDSASLVHPFCFRLKWASSWLLLMNSTSKTSSVLAQSLPTFRTSLFTSSWPSSLSTLVSILPT